MFSFLKNLFTDSDAFSKKKDLEITFATACYENDWEFILKKEDYLEKLMISNHNFPFKEKILIINNVNNYASVAACADKLVNKGVLTKYIFAKDHAEKVLSFFNLKRSDFIADRIDKGFGIVSDDWIYYNAIAPLTAIYHCETPYFLYLTGDCFLGKKEDWILPTIAQMHKNKKYKVANLLITNLDKKQQWLSKGEIPENLSEEAIVDLIVKDSLKGEKKDAYKVKKSFFFAKKGFSDICFLVKTEDFKKPIYNEIREDSAHFPRGDVFEKRVYSFMKNHKWQRITYVDGTCSHKSIR